MWLAEQLEAGQHLCDCSRGRKQVGEWFRTDAKGDPDKVVLGGWESRTSPDPRACHWFQYILTREEYPWLFKETKKGWASSPTISSGELLGTMFATHLFVPKSLASKAVCRFTALTDNQGNTYIPHSHLTTKWPLAAVWMQFSLHLASKDLELQLEWLPRELSIPADDITNSDFSKFNPDLRIQTPLPQLVESMDLKVLHTLLSAWGELETLIKKRKEEQPQLQPGTPTKTTRRRRVKEKWG